METERQNKIRNMILKARELVNKEGYLIFLRSFFSAVQEENQDTRPPSEADQD